MLMSSHVSLSYIWYEQDPLNENYSDYQELELVEKKLKQLIGILNIRVECKFIPKILKGSATCFCFTYYFVWQFLFQLVNATMGKYECKSGFQRSDKPDDMERLQAFHPK